MTTIKIPLVFHGDDLLYPSPALVAGNLFENVMMKNIPKILKSIDLTLGFTRLRWLAVT